MERNSEGKHPVSRGSVESKRALRWRDGIEEGSKSPSLFALRHKDVSNSSDRSEESWSVVASQEAHRRGVDVPRSNIRAYTVKI